MHLSRKALSPAIPVLLAMAGLLAACENLPPPEGPMPARALKPKPPQEDPVEKAVRDRRERNAYAIPPRSYPSQTNTTPLGWQPPAAAAQSGQTAEAPAPTGATASAGPAAAAAAPASRQPPRPTDKPAMPTMPAQPAQAAMPSQPAAGADANPPLPAGYVPSVPAPAGMPVIASMPPASMPPAAASAAGAPSGNWHAHIASHRSEEAAINDWQRRLKENPSVYGALEPALLWVDVPNRGSYARLVFGSFASKADVQAACSKISGPGRYCNAIQD